MILELSLTLNGIKTTFSAEISPETYPPLSAPDLNQSSIEYTDDVLLEAAILPSVMEATGKLIEANHILSGNLAKHHLHSLRASNNLA